MFFCNKWCAADDRNHEIVYTAVNPDRDSSSKNYPNSQNFPRNSQSNNQQPDLAGRLIESTVQQFTNIEDIPLSDNTVYQKLVKSNYDKLVNTYKGTKSKYTDPEFPPNSKSLGSGLEVRGKKIVWKRASEFISDLSFISNDIEPADITQGNLGDCYFLSVISALAEIPERIRILFDNWQINPNGFYKVTVNVKGIRKEVIVDDYFPVLEHNNQPVFTKPNEGEIWVMILEKVWAKLSGSYARIISGFPHEVMTAFCMAPCFYYELETAARQRERLWSDLLEAEKQQFAVCCGSKQNVDPNSGIVPSHTYTLLASYEVPVGGLVERILKIRNPWAYKQYTGRFSQNDVDFWQKVSSIEKQKIGMDKASDDGVFFMDYEDFLLYFETLDVSHYRKTYNYNFEMCSSGPHNGVFVQFKLDVPEENLYVVLQQDSLRNSSVDIANIRYARSVIIVAKKVKIEDTEENRVKYGNRLYDYQWIDGKMETNFPTTPLRLRDLPAGDYVIFAKCQWADEQKHQLCVAVYSPKMLHLQASSKKENIGMIERCLLSHALGNPHKKELGNGDWICTELLYKEGGYAYIAVNVGETSKKKIMLEFIPEQQTLIKIVIYISIYIRVRVFESAGFKVKGAKRKYPNKKQRVKLIVGAGQAQIIVCRIQKLINTKQLVFPPDFKVAQSV